MNDSIMSAGLTSPNTTANGVSARTPQTAGASGFKR